MPKELNTTCSICGTRYHACATCKSTKILKPWRTVTDTIDCYKIYMIVHDYTNDSITKDNAKEMLKNCKIPEALLPHVKNVIDEIKGSDKKTKPEIKKGAADNNLRNNEQ